jgi:hypothetical protein
MIAPRSEKMATKATPAASPQSGAASPSGAVAEPDADAGEQRQAHQEVARAIVRGAPRGALAGHPGELAVRVVEDRARRPRRPPRFSGPACPLA